MSKHLSSLPIPNGTEVLSPQTTSSADIQLLMIKVGGLRARPQKARNDFFQMEPEGGSGLSVIGQRCLGPILLSNYKPEKQVERPDKHQWWWWQWGYLLIATAASGMPVKKGRAEIWKEREERKYDIS